MRNFNASILLTLISFSNFSVVALDKTELSDETRDYMISEGLPLPNSGIRVVEKIDTSDLSFETLQIRDKAKKEMESKGYYESNNVRANELLKMNKSSAVFFDAKNLKQTITGYRKSPKNLKLTFDFNKLNSVNLHNNIKVIGYAPEGVYVKGKGWTGAVANFKSSFGVCSFNKSDLQETGMSINYSKDEITYDINDKITSYESYGSNEAKFLYDIVWYDKKFYRQLECASEVYSSEIKDKVFKLAKELDTSI